MRGEDCPRLSTHELVSRAVPERTSYRETQFSTFSSSQSDGVCIVNNCEKLSYRYNSENDKENIKKEVDSALVQKRTSSK